MANHHQEQHEVYVIPPNFIDRGTLFGGMFKLRNAIEALALALLFGLPTFQLPFGLTTKIIILCLTALPLTLLAIIGISGESLSSFVINFFRFRRNRRVIKRSDMIDENEVLEKKIKRRKKKRKNAKQRRKTRLKKDSIPKPRKYTKDFAEEFGSERSENRRARRAAESRTTGHNEKKKHKQKPRLKVLDGLRSDHPNYNPLKAKTVEEYLPISRIEKGMVYTKDGRYLRILEIEPVNFTLRSAREQKSIIYSFVSYLKISPVKLQIKVLTKKADINRHLDMVYQQMRREKDEKCRILQEDYIDLIRTLGMREAITRRFLLIFEFEPFAGSRKTDEKDALVFLDTAVQTAKNYFRQCGNTIIEHENEDEFQTEVLYSILNRRTSSIKSLPERVSEVAARYMHEGNESGMDDISVCEFIAPESIDITNGHYIQMDGLYHAFLLIPSDGYKSHVNAGWMSLLVNAGEGIDVDIFFSRQPKERVIQKLGQQLRINRSKIKDASDTNTDFDDLENAISSGYFLKEGLANNQDFYYMSTVITITAEDEEELEWRVNEMKKLLVSQDLNTMPCTYRVEQAVNTVLPLVNQDKMLFEKSKRNVLTLGAASCYPFVSYEVSDDNGILMGINKHNNSLVIIDIFNALTYKNANIALLGTSGAGKTFLMQLMALRMRRKNTQVFIIAPLKGHEFKRACDNIGGAFISISPASPTCINVMAINKSDNEASELLDGRIQRSELAAKIQRLHVFFSLLIPDMNHEEKQLLDEAMIQTYFKKGITHNNESLIDPNNPAEYREMPLLGDLHEILKAQPETKRLANILNRLVNGSASSFNQHTNVSLDNLYTVLDVSENTGELLVVAMYVALDFVWSKAKQDRTVEKAIMIDEVWQLIGASSNSMAAEVVLEIAKIIRGYGGSSLFATQDLNDFFSLDGGKYGKGILNNCKTKVVMNLEEEEAQRVESVLGLSESEVMSITRFERGSGLIITNNNTVTVDFKASKLETDLITTDRVQLQQLVRDKKKTILDLNEQQTLK